MGIKAQMFGEQHSGQAIPRHSIGTRATDLVVAGRKGIGSKHDLTAGAYAPQPRIGPPVDDLVSAQGYSLAQMCFIADTEGLDTGIFQVFGWTPVLPDRGFRTISGEVLDRYNDALWVPRLLCDGTISLGSVEGVAANGNERGVVGSIKFADEIVISEDGTIGGTADVRVHDKEHIAWLMLDLSGCPYVQVFVDGTNYAVAGALIQLL